MKKKDLAHVRAQAKVAQELEDSLAYAENELNDFEHKKNLGHRVKMVISFYKGDNDYQSCVTCTRVPQELLCLAGLVLKERRDWLQKQFDDLTIGTTAPEDRQ